MKVFLTRSYLFFVFTLLVPLLWGQHHLMSTIGQSTLPKDRDLVGYKEMMKYAPMPGFACDECGPAEGDIIPDFTLFTLDGTPVNIGDVLSTGKPILLVSGSYTCWVFRDNIPVINRIDSIYKEELAVFIVYTAEAHPTDPNPYSGAVWVNGRVWFHGNVIDGILYNQPRTYGERKSLVKKMIKKLHIHSEVIIDGPGNEWWHYFGPAPNNAYLIAPDGKINSKHPWFNQGLLDMENDIASLLTGRIYSQSTSFDELAIESWEANQFIHSAEGALACVEPATEHIECLEPAPITDDGPTCNNNNQNERPTMERRIKHMSDHMSMIDNIEVALISPAGILRGDIELEFANQQIEMALNGLRKKAEAGPIPDFERFLFQTLTALCNHNLIPLEWEEMIVNVINPELLSGHMWSSE
ncbi:MAG: hypothetical protein O2887_06075 [Bacteroidetes bacterium]|nr:hypothetical protein [Bacteroidota bacterium]MDA1120049.1 hypothetical protein [Bacteroidota bacterium]